MLSDNTAEAMERAPPMQNPTTPTFFALELLILWRKGVLWYLITSFGLQEVCSSSDVRDGALERSVRTLLRSGKESYGPI